MSVVSPSITVTVSPAVAYNLTITVDKTTGVVGEVFTFGGFLSADGSGIDSVTVELVLEGVGVVGSSITAQGGGWQIAWTADREGNLVFYAQATV